MQFLKNIREKLFRVECKIFKKNYNCLSILTILCLWFLTIIDLKNLIYQNNIFL